MPTSSTPNSVSLPDSTCPSRSIAKVAPPTVTVPRPQSLRLCGRESGRGCDRGRDHAPSSAPCSTPQPVSSQHRAHATPLVLVDGLIRRLPTRTRARLPCDADEDTPRRDRRAPDRAAPFSAPHPLVTLGSCNAIYQLKGVGIPTEIPILLSLISTRSYHTLSALPVLQNRFVSLWGCV